MQSGVVRPAFAPRHAGPVVAVIKDDGVVAESRCFEFLQILTDEGIHLGDLIVILCPVLPHFRRIGMISGNANFGRVVHLFVRPGTDLAFVADGVIEDRKKRLAFFAVFPVGFSARFIPDLARLFEIVIFFAVVGAVVTGFAQILRIHFEPVRQTGHASHVFGAGRGWIQSGDQRRSGGCAHRCRRPAVQIDHPFGGDRIDVGRIGKRVAVTAQMRAVVFAGDPKNVRFLSSLNCDGRKQRHNAQ